ncbi:MAG: DMT family transporter, partial [Proteobacteria bacterium]|nr:DMT family transporter [Pseudomonadota bacterium]
MTKATNPDRGAYAGLVFATLIFSFTAVFIRLSEVGPAATGFWRFLFTIPFMLVWIVFASRRSRVRVMLANRREYLWMLFASLMLTLNVITWQSAVLMTSIANAVLISNLHPIVVAIGAFFLFRERITAIFAVGLMLALVGTAMLVRAGMGSFGVINYGDGLAVLGAVFFGLWVLCLKNQRGSYSTPVTMLWNIGLACPMILLTAGLLEDALFPETPAGW